MRPITHRVPVRPPAHLPLLTPSCTLRECGEEETWGCEGQPTGSPLVPLCTARLVDDTQWPALLCTGCAPLPCPHGLFAWALHGLPAWRAASLHGTRASLAALAAHHLAYLVAAYLLNPFSDLIVFLLADCSGGGAGGGCTGGGGTGGGGRWAKGVAGGGGLYWQGFKIRDLLTGVNEASVSPLDLVLAALPSRSPP
jgi:hypothetical protein